MRWDWAVWTFLNSRTCCTAARPVSRWGPLQAGCSVCRRIPTRSTSTCNLSIAVSQSSVQYTVKNIRIYTRANTVLRYSADLRIQTHTEPVPLKYGKLATKYPWIYTDIFLQCSKPDVIDGEWIVSAAAPDGSARRGLDVNVKSKGKRVGQLCN